MKFSEAFHNFTVFSACFLALSFLFPLQSTPQDKSGPQSPVLEKAIMLNDSGIRLWQKKEFARSLELFNEALSISEKNNFVRQRALSLNNIGLVNYSQGKYNECLDYYNRALDLIRQVGDTLKTATFLLNTGIVYKRQGIYDKATRCLIEALQAFEEKNYETGMTSCYNTLANIQNELGNYQEALEYHYKALKLREKKGDKTEIASTLNNLGSVYRNMDSLQIALDFYERSLAIKKGLGDKELIASTLSNIGKIEVSMKKLDQAENSFLESFRIRSEINDQNGMITAANELGELYLLTNRTKEAEKYLAEAKALAKKINSVQLNMDNAKLLTQLYEQQGKPEKALVAYKEYDTLKDQVFNNEKVKTLNELKIKYETEKNEMEIQSLNKIKVSQEEKIRAKSRMQAALTFGLAMFFLLNAFVYRSYRQKRRDNLEIRTLMQERQHRAKNNLQLITGLLSLQSEQASQAQVKGAIQSGENRMQAVAIIDKMLYENEVNTEIDMQVYIQKLVENLKSVFGKDFQKVNANLEIDELKMDASKATPLGLIINELVTNSFKYAFHKSHAPRLSIQLFRDEEREVSFSYSDNGPGLPVGFNSNVSTSLGLRLVNSLATQLKGNLEILNEGGFTCRFKFRI